MSSTHGQPAPEPSPPPLTALGWSDRWQPYLPSDGAGLPGRILRHDGAAVLVATETGTHHVHLRPSTEPLAVGDWIVTSEGYVDDVLPRSSLLRRRDPSTGDSQLIAANVDIVGIVCGLDRPVKTGRIQRFMTLAWDAGASPLVVLSKADLVEDPSEAVTTVLDWDPGADVVVVSATSADGVSELLERCADRTLVLVGESGAGKSTLVNALAGTTLAETRHVRSGDHKGRHTTTSRQLHLLAGDCRLIDTPGVREVGLSTDVATVDDVFADIAELADTCRFGDCGHRGEPGCAVQAAVEDGDLSEDRLESWERLRREALAAEIRADPAARHRADRQFGKMVREVKKMKRDER